jgi:hypothetical protein
MAEDTGPARNPRFDDDLVGLDPDDPEAQAFAAHLDRMQRCDPTFTVEGSLRGVADFADGSNRAGGLRWWVAVLVVCLIMAGVVVAAWDTLEDLLNWLAR